MIRVTFRGETNTSAEAITDGDLLRMVAPFATAHTFCASRDGDLLLLPERWDLARVIETQKENLGQPRILKR